MKVEQKIFITLDGKEFTLTRQEALKLYNELEVIFGNKCTVAYPIEQLPWMHQKPFGWPEVTYGGMAPRDNM